ncbi:MAG: CidA/LrgA family protein [Bacteroides sp.]|nr:CidA/LrgA family protein [Bacteroides sp.]
MIIQCAILFGCLALGELIVYLTGVKFPSSIIGMIFLAYLLKMNWLDIQKVKKLSDFLVANLAFFFVPPGVALVLYFNRIVEEWFPILTATVVSTILVIAVTGWIHQLMRRIR